MLIKPVAPVESLSPRLVPAFQLFIVQRVELLAAPAFEESLSAHFGSWQCSGRQIPRELCTTADLRPRPCFISHTGRSMAKASMSKGDG